MGVIDDIPKNADKAAKEIADKQKAKAEQKKKGTAQPL